MGREEAPEPVEVVDRLLWRDAQQILRRHAAPDGEDRCQWCGDDWPCPPRLLAQRAEEAARRPWPEPWPEPGSGRVGEPPEAPGAPEPAHGPAGRPEPAPGAVVRPQPARNLRPMPGWRLEPGQRGTARRSTPPGRQADRRPGGPVRQPNGGLFD